VAFSEEDLKDFKVEAFEILDDAEAKFFAMESGGDYRTLFDSVFRAFHNLKGASGMMELHVLQAHVHELETILMSFKEKPSIPKNYITLFLSGIDGARSILDGKEIHFSFEVAEEASAEESAPVSAPNPAPLEASATYAASSNASVEEFLAEGAEIIERISAQIRTIEGKSHTVETIHDLYRDIHSLKGAAHLFGYVELGAVAHAMEASMEPVREGTVQPTPELIEGLYASIRAIEGELENIRKPTVVAAVQPSEEKTPAPVASKANVASNSESEGDAAGSIRVPVSLLDNLMTLMGEMVLVRNQVIQFSNESEDLDFLNLSKRLNLVTSEIQGEMMKTRMQPIGTVLSKYHRVVRDLSRDLKKSIHLQLSGAETELDKSLLESIKDPLTHIVRNSCDHGIETPEVRRGAGKSEQGNISIRSYHEGGQVVIEVTDDGKGLHKEALVRKALEKGLLTQAQASALSDKDIFNLIFAPGFSTASVVTNVSGRGVGMDVVRTNIEKIGGTVELTSVEGQGTTTKIKIPLTLAIIPALIIRTGNETFAIPQVKLEELVCVDQASSENKIEYLHGAPILRLRGNILPLVDLSGVLGLSSQRSENEPIHNIAVLSGEHCSFGLIVDEIQDTADIVVKPLNRLLRSLQVYSGATILGDGSIALILDIVGLSKVARIESASENRVTQVGSQFHASDHQEYLLVKLNSPTKHAIVLGYVNRLEEFKRSDIEFSGSTRVIRYGKTILPIISVNRLLGYEEPAVQPAVIPVVVIQKAGLLYGLEVEEIVDTLSTDAEVDSTFTRQPGFFGNLNTPDGLIVAIDPFELIDIQHPDKSIQKGSQSTQKVTRPLKILFAEDTVFFRKAVSIILQKEGHDVTHAVDGKEAFEIISQSPEKFDLIISDIEMPRMNGFELATAVRASGKHPNLPLLALSSRADKKYADLGLQAGFNRYLEKLKPAVLLEAIAELSVLNREAA
jgi:two-component system, chemotaxis family, sensor kinase CheA